MEVGKMKYNPSLLLLFIIICLFISCFGLQIRKSDLDIKKKGEPNGYLKIVFKGDLGHYTPKLKINLTEKYPMEERIIPMIYLEDLDAIYSLQGRIETSEILIPIKQGEYFASIVNEELFESGAAFIIPLLFHEDKYIGISFGFDEKYDSNNYIMNSLKSGKCLTRTKERPYILLPYKSVDIDFNHCPKLKIVANKVTEIVITFSDEKLDGWRSFFVVIPGILVGLPLFGTLYYKSDSTVEIKYPDDTMILNKVKSEARKVKANGIRSSN
jgi:hypothetical protein